MCNFQRAVVTLGINISSGKRDRSTAGGKISLLFGLQRTRNGSTINNFQQATTGVATPENKSIKGKKKNVGKEGEAAGFEPVYVFYGR